ncbi:SLC13 family permease [Desulfitobacterium sp.]|uniref:SLC13 family permease n=1 Tax=Desulfitobacterium sp. TaxID=49981 RepID=UPI002C282AAC|nr:SLC13 family permease [Desulfitobacterium sp.]HVJ48958.1 SLC13 family permease [Desulfitobacterium sp.]
MFSVRFLAGTGFAHFLASNMDMISLLLLAVAIVISIWKNTNLGTLSLGLALIVGYFIGGVPIKTLIAGYPTSLLIMLAGVTFLFGIAQTNGTLEKITGYAVKSAKGNIAVIPIVLFFLAFAISSIGPGQISTAALLAAPVMVLATEVEIPPLLMALVVGSGAQAGAMSPLAQNGIIGNAVLAKMGITNMAMTLWLNMLIANAVCAVLAYCLFGGLKLWKKRNDANSPALVLAKMKIEPFNFQQKCTLVSIGILVIAVVFFSLDIGFTAFLLGSILILMKCGDEKAAFKAMPWGAIMLVTGVSVMVSLMSNIGGMSLFAAIMAKFSTPFTANLVIGFFSGLVSAYASTSGVIMPAFLPMAPLLLQKIGANPAALPGLLTTIVVCGHLTDLSPLSTTGAVFISGAPDNVDSKPLFKGMMIWGLSMSVFGAVLAWILYTFIGIV